MAIEIIYTIVDSSGEPATTSVKVADETTIAGLNGFAVGWANALNDIIRGAIRNAIAHLLVNITGLTSNTIISSSDVEHLGKFQFLTAAGRRVEVNVPCIAEFTVDTDVADEMDTAQADVAAFLSMMEDGISVSGALIQPCDIGGEDIVSTAFAREGARNSGRRGR